MVKPIQVLLLTTDFKPNVGGIAEYLHNLWNELSDRCSATVISTIPSINNQWNHKYTLKNFSNSSNLVASANQEKQNSINSSLLSLLHYHPSRELLPFINSLSQENLYIFIGVWHPISHFWCRALRQAGIKYYLFAYGKELVLSQYNSLSASRLEDFSYAQRIYTCSNATTQLVKQTLNPPVTITTIYPGVHEFQNKADVDLRKKLNLHSGPILLSLSRLVFRKGIDLVLDSLTSIVKDFPTLNYLIVGDGEERDNLERKAITLGINSHVNFLGRVNEETKQALLSLCDLFVLPNREDRGEDWEGFGIVFLEAAIAGKASIGGKSGGVVEAIIPGVTGLLVNTEDTQDLQNALYNLLSNPNLLQQMGNAAKKRAQQQFNWSTSVNQLLQTLH